MTFTISRPPPCLHFPSKFEWSPLWILPKFSAIPAFGFSVTTDPPFCSPKNQVIPSKILRPRTQAINNDRSLTHIWHTWQDLKPGQIDGSRVLWPLPHPSPMCSVQKKKTMYFLKKWTSNTFNFILQIKHRN